MRRCSRLPSTLPTEVSRAPDRRRARSLAGGFAWLEQGGRDSAREITLVATLGGIAAAGRVLFTPIPNVQPVTVIVAATGVALGPRHRFAVGALAAVASNIFLGQGPADAVADAGVGRGAAPLGGVRDAAAADAGSRSRSPCSLLGLAFGSVLDLWLWFAFYPHTWPLRHGARQRAFRSTSRTPPETSCSRSPRVPNYAAPSTTRTPPATEVIWA